MNKESMTALDYAKLIQLIAANKYNVLLSRIKVRNILFYIYGAYLADNGKTLFNDEKPKALVSGPTFENAYKGMKSYELITIDDFTNDQIKGFKDNIWIVSKIIRIVGNMYGVTAMELNQKARRESSPWYTAIYRKDKDGNLISQKSFGTVINDGIITKYFSKMENRIFG